MNKKTVTVREVAQAMIDDRTPKTTHKYVQQEVLPGVTMVDPIRLGPVTASCAVGGAAITLGVEWTDLDTELARVPRDGVKPRRGSNMSKLVSVITDLNDNTKYSKAEIGRRILAQADEQTLNTQLTLSERKWEVA